MRQSLINSLVLFAAGCLFWLLASATTGAREPWDAKSYWSFWYPALLVLSGLTGPLFKRQAWMAGAVLTMAQLPIALIGGGAGSLWAAGLVILCALTIPAMAVSALVGWLVTRARSDPR